MVSSTGLNHLISFYKKVQVHFGQNNIEEVLISFVESNTGRMVYDDSTKLWWDGPLSVAQEYKNEMGIVG